MPHFTLEKLPDHPALLLTLHAEYVATRDLTESNPLVYNMLEAAAEPLYYIIDVGTASFSVEDMIQTASTTSRSSMATFAHSNVRGVIVITDDALIRMALQGLDSEAFGFVKVQTVATLDAALDYVRSN